jgi:hypothetical protein
MLYSPLCSITSDEEVLFMSIPKLTVINGGKANSSFPRIRNCSVMVSDNRRVPTGAVITSQHAANCLPRMLSEFEQWGRYGGSKLRRWG